MVEDVKCECGEANMLHGRCCGCGRVRPSSEKLLKEIGEAAANLCGIKKELQRAIRLETEDAHEAHLR